MESNYNDNEKDNTNIKVYNKSIIVNKIKKYLAHIDKLLTKERKKIFIYYLFGYLYSNIDFIKNYSKFKNTVLAKICEIENEIKNEDNIYSQRIKRMTTLLLVNLTDDNIYSQRIKTMTTNLLVNLNEESVSSSEV